MTDTAPRRTARRRRTPRQERKLEQFEQIQESRDYLGDPTPLLATAQGIFHFDLDDQVNKLIEARQEDPELGFIMRLLALCTLPRTNPGKRERYVRRNGPWAMVMIAGGTEGRLPYGTLPRLVLAWICTEAVRTQSRRLTLGRSLSEFMRKLDLNPSSGGAKSDRGRLHNQLERLLRATVELNYSGEKGTHWVGDRITNESHLWWDPRRPDEPVLWESSIELGEKFFKEIIGRPIPIDMNVLKAMKRSALGLDLYLWLTCKLYKLKVPWAIEWRKLYAQFAPNPTAGDRFAINGLRKDVLRELKKLKAAWPELDYRTPKGRLELRPTRPLIDPRPEISTDPV